MPVIVTFQHDNQIYLLANEKENVVRDFETVEKGLAYFEGAYARKHGLGYEGSISASLNYISFQPSVHEWKYADLAPMLEQGIIEDESFHGCLISNVSGTMYGALCTGANAKTFHESGIKPKLI